MYEFESKDKHIIEEKDRPQIQQLAEFLGWQRDKAVKVKITNAEIAPNGTRRERRINNGFIPEDTEGNEYIARINANLS